MHLHLATNSDIDLDSSYARRPILNTSVSMCEYPLASNHSYPLCLNSFRMLMLYAGCLRRAQPAQRLVTVWAHRLTKCLVINHLASIYLRKEGVKTWTVLVLIIKRQWTQLAHLLRALRRTIPMVRTTKIGCGTWRMTHLALPINHFQIVEWLLILHLR